MNRLTISLTLVALWTAACAPAAGSTSTPSAPEPGAPTPTPVRMDLTPAQRAAFAALGLAPAEVTLVSTAAVDWPDACLGVTRPEVMCAQVITPGFRIVLAAQGREYEYHTNADGSVVVPATLALTWQRAGGFAGFCDNLTVYASGEVAAATCNGAGAEGVLTAAELTQLDDWLAEFGAVQILNRDRAVADGMTVALTLNGSGSAQPADDEKQALVSWAQSVYARIQP